MGPDDYLMAADTTNVQAGGSSFFDDVGDAVTKGAPAALLSGVASIYNTGVSVANYFGADAERIDVANTLTSLDQNWGDYYKQNQSVIDTAGFIAGSFIPGGIAVKGLQLARRGEALGAFGRALNYTSVRQQAALETAMQTLATPEGSVFKLLNKDFLQSVGWATADQGLQNLAFMTAATASMQASPLLEGQDWKDMGYDIIKSSFFGGLLGGGVEGLLMNRTVKDTVTLIDRAGKKYNTLSTAFDKTALTEADKTYALMDS